MKKVVILLTTILFVWSCDDSSSVDPVSSVPDKFLIVNNITSGATPTAYIGTFKDLDIGSQTNEKSQQFTSYPFLHIHGEDVFVTQNRSGDDLVKFTRQPDGALLETGRLSMGSGTQPMHVIVESSDRAYCSLYIAGTVEVFNPTTMTKIESIDLTSFAKGDGSPDPGIMVYKDGLLYVAVNQTTDTYTSDKPAELLIIDTDNGNQITSITDDRATYLGNVDAPSSIFFDEKGDLYVYALSSWGFYPGQTAGWLRVKSGETEFDKNYFFNTTDYSVTGVEGNKIDYLQHPMYYGNGIMYSAGNVPALASNPPDYVKDRTFAAFQVDIYNQTITKLDIPNSNGYAASVLTLPDEGKVLFGMSATSAVGIFEYNHDTNTGNQEPIITTQGDPGVIDVFK